MSIATLSDLVFHIREISGGRKDLISTWRNGRRETLSNADFLRSIHSLALALESHGLTKDERVAIFSENRPEWHITDLACQLIGAPTVPLYPELAPQQVGFILRNSGCRWIFYSDRSKRDLLGDLVPTLTSPANLVAFDSEAAKADGTSITRLMGEGAARMGDAPIERFRGQVTEEDLASLIYTSGVTGDPKGVMLSQRNLVSNILACGEIFALSTDDQALSVLPLSHGFQRMVDHLCLYRGVPIHHAASIDELSMTLLREQPTVMTAVPSIYEHAYQQAQGSLGPERSARRRFFKWAIAAGMRRAVAQRDGFVGPLLSLQWIVADFMVLRRIRRLLGGRLRLPILGGASISMEISDFYEAIGTPLFQGYGLTETSPVLASSAPRQTRPGSVGKALPAVELKVADDGEILAKGPGVMKGYWANPRATAESVDDSGWLHTGDVGRIDQSGYIFITDRKLDFLFLTTGERIAPQPIEQRLAHHSLIAQAVVIGDGRPYLTALLVPDLDQLRAGDGELAEPEVTQRTDVLKRIDKAVSEVNLQLPKEEQIARWRLLENELSVEKGELTHTGKLKRRIVLQRHAEIITALYSDEAVSRPSGT